MLSRDNLGNMSGTEIELIDRAWPACPRSPETAIDQLFHHARHPGRSCPSLPSYYSRFCRSNNIGLSGITSVLYEHCLES